METNTQPQQPRRPHQQSRSEANMEYFALRVTTPPTYKQVALHELKRASVYAPIIFTTVVSALWASRKIILSMPAVP